MKRKTKFQKGKIKEYDNMTTMSKKQMKRKAKFPKGKIKEYDNMTKSS